MDSIVFKAGYKYQLVAPYTHETGIELEHGVSTPFLRMYTNGRLVINSGYAWDGPSGPAIDSKNFMRGSLVHDALYQLMRMGHLAGRYRERADRILQEICLADGMWRIRAWWVYFAVSRFAGPMAAKGNRRAIVRAPK